jgi:hypothetical protein
LEPQVESVPVEGEISFPSKAFTIDLSKDKYEDVKSFHMVIDTKAISEGTSFACLFLMEKVICMG